MSASEQMNALCCFSVVTCKYDGIIDVGNAVARADASVFVFEVDDGYLYVRRASLLQNWCKMVLIPLLVF